MPGKILSLTVLALLMAAPAPAQETGRSELEESLGRPRRLPPIPADLRPLFREITRDRLVVRGLGGGEIVIDIDQYEPDDFRTFAGGRFLGFSFMGYESAGYMLVDRTMSGDEAIIATGVAPSFSSDGRYFASVEMSGADIGNLEAFAVWEVAPQGTRQRLYVTALPSGEDWRVDGWPREDCVALSAAPPGTGDSAPPAERIRISVEVGERIALDGVSSPPCGVTDATRPDG